MSEDSRMDRAATILVADDDPVMLRMTARLLKKAGHKVVEATAGDEALRLARGELPDLAVLDVVMPGLDGIEVCRRIQDDEELRGVYVMLLSGVHTESESQAVGLEAGADDYVARPISNQELLARVEALLRLKRAQEALHRSERRFRSFVEQSQDAIVLTDEAGALVEWNPAAERFFGWEREEVLGRKFWDVQFEAVPKGRRTPAARDRLKAALLQALRTGSAPWLGEARRVEAERPDGERRIFEMISFSIETDEGFQVGGISRDVTERERMERELRESQERYRNLVENQGEGIGIVAPDETFVFANPAAHDLFGVPSGSLVGRSLEEFLDEEGRATVAAQTERRASGEEDTYEIDIIRPNGERRTLLVTASPRYDEEGHFEGTFAVFRDVTRRREMERSLQTYSEQLEEMVEERTRELREAQEKLLRRQKLAALGQLAGSINHELRGPLGNIRSGAYFLDMALEEPDEDVQETLDLIQQEVDRADAIIRSLLSFVRTEEPRREDVDVNDLIDELLDDTGVPEGIEVLTEMARGLPPVSADPEQLRQVFRNLISNAIDAMPAGGELTVETWERSQEAPELGEALVAISDTGEGIPEETRERIFEPLFSTKADGVGLGLPLARMLVEAHGGEIDVESEEGKGTTFTVRLPLAQVEGAEAQGSGEDEGDGVTG